MPATLRSAALLAKRAERLRGPMTPPQAHALPALWFFTDPARTPRPLSIAARLPEGCGVVYRHFGRAGAHAEAEALAEIAEARGLLLLIAADAALADRVGAAGVHLPERLLSEARGIRRRRSDWILTAAAHSARAVRRAASVGVDGIVLSAVFRSASPSAGRPLGPLRFAAIAHGVATPVYALGGVTKTTIRRLEGHGAAGVAAVDALGA